MTKKDILMARERPFPIKMTLNFILELSGSRTKLIRLLGRRAGTY